MVVDRSPSPHEEASPVKMVVIDGVVMGPTHCAYDDCTQDLQNACGGVFCGFHEIVVILRNCFLSLWSKISGNTPVEESKKMGIL
jgi:hypothetical protein